MSFLGIVFAPSSAPASAEEAHPDSWFAKYEVEAVACVVQKANDKGGKWKIVNAEMSGGNLDCMEIRSGFTNLQIDLFKITNEDEPLYFIRCAERVLYTRDFPEFIGLFDDFITPLNRFEQTCCMDCSPA